MADLPKLRQRNAVVSVGAHQIRTGNRLAFVHLSDLPFVCGVRERARAGLGASWRGTSLQVFWSSGLVPRESEVRIILRPCACELWIRRALEIYDSSVLVAHLGRDGCALPQRLFRLSAAWSDFPTQKPWRPSNAFTRTRSTSH